MTELLTIKPADMDRLLARLDDLDRKLDAVRMAPEPQWLTVRDYAAKVGRSVSTVNRWIAAGSVETRMSGKARLVKA